MDVKIEARIFEQPNILRSRGFPFLHHELGAQREYGPALLLNSVDVQRGVRWTSECDVSRPKKSLSRPAFTIMVHSLKISDTDCSQKVFGKYRANASATLSSRFRHRRLLSASVARAGRWWLPRFEPLADVDPGRPRYRRRDSHPGRDRVDRPPVWDQCRLGGRDWRACAA
jgi:hypothetical protein